MADQEMQPSRTPSRAEQRMAAVAKIRRATSLPRMKDGRRLRPMHVEAVSEGEKPPTDEERIDSETEKQKTAEGQTNPESDEAKDIAEEHKGPLEPGSNQILTRSAEIAADVELDAENPDTELEERPMSPTPGVTKKRRSRSRSRSRGSKDLKGKLKPPASPMPQLGGDSSQDETPAIPSPMLMPMLSPLASPVPHFPFLQQSRILRSPTPLPPEMTLYYPGPSPPTPLPTLADLQRGLMRSNSVGTAAAGRRLAMHKLTGGTESYDPSPSPTPPPKLGRNNTVSGGERIAARENMLSRLGTRVTREADAEAASGTEEKNTAPQHSRRRNRRRSKGGPAVNATTTTTPVSDSDIPSTDGYTPAVASSSLPELQDQYVERRMQSTTPSQAFSSRSQSSDWVSNASPPPLPPVTQPPKEEHERPEQHRRRSVIIEDPDDDVQNASAIPLQHYSTLPGTPQRTLQELEAIRTHASNSPSNGSSSDSGRASAVGVPVIFSQRATSRNEPFPTSPFPTPMKPRPLSDYEEEQVLYPATTARPRTPYAHTVQIHDREISWIASPVPEIRMPIHDDEESEPEEDADFRDQDVLITNGVDHEEEENPPSVSAESSNSFSPDVYNDMSPRVSASSKSILVESETSPEPAYLAFPAVTSVSPASSAIKVEGSVSQQSFPQRLSVASRFGERSPLSVEFAELDNYTDSPKRAETGTPSTWEKVKNTLVRAGSSSGRRSRTNSIVTRERRDNTDSSVSRESGGSLTMGKIDSAPSIQLQAPSLMQTPSASASILSLTPAPPRMSASPIPPASDMSRYQNSKLMPFPGIVKLEEERRRNQLPTPSSLDGAHYSDELHPPPMTPSWSSGSSQTADPGERKLFYENSDLQPAGTYLAESKLSVQEYIDLSLSHQQNGSISGMKLPMTLPGVKLWLKNSKKKTPTQSAGNSASVSPSPPSGMDSNASAAAKRPSLSDLFTKRPSDNDWEEALLTPDTSKPGNGTRAIEAKPSNFDTTIRGQSFPVDSTPLREAISRVTNDPSSLSRVATITPASSSISDYPAPTPSESSSTSSNSSLNGRHGLLVLEKLEENLSRVSRSPMWNAAVDDPPRKLVLSSPVLQVVNQNTVKDRFLFLFTDILVIAKSVAADHHDSLTDPFKLSLPDKKYTVKNVVQLQKLRFCADRMEAPKSLVLGPRNTLIRSFISEFIIDPDRAIASLFTKVRLDHDPSLLGQLLFKTIELDRSRLGDYLCRRTSKAVLKSYLDSFNFVGLRVDVALRVFLHSINISQYAHTYGTLEYLLDSFASRWYEANTKFVAYDKDMAVQLVWALAQLNDRLHGPIADEPGATDKILRTVTTREFQEAFRRYDTRYLVSDDLLQELYRSIFHERLCQACPSILNSQEIPITIKRPLPNRLTYKAQSEPIVFRLPQPDPHFTIELYGQDLIFDPPILQFSRSSETSFRVTGSSLGLKTMTMCRSGPNGTKYSGLPLSHSIAVERAFMKNTFQIAFLNPTGNKRRYMFSVDDPIIRNEWATCLRRQIDSSNATAAALKSAGDFASSKFHRAAQTIGFEILQERLVGCKTAGQGYSADSLPNGTTLPQLTGSSTPFTTTPIHQRSKSRSRLYHLHGAGKDELELNRLQNVSVNSNYSSVSTPEYRADGPVWTSRDLELYCQQNSSISLVLSFLQVGVPEGAAS